MPRSKWRSCLKRCSIRERHCRHQRCSGGVPSAWVPFRLEITPRTIQSILQPIGQPLEEFLVSLPRIYLLAPVDAASASKTCASWSMSASWTPGVLCGQTSLPFPAFQLGSCTVRSWFTTVVFIGSRPCTSSTRGRWRHHVVV